MRQFVSVSRSVGARPSVSLHCKHRAGLVDDIANKPGKQAGSCVQIGDTISGPCLKPLQHGSTKDVSRAGVHLPEDSRTHLVVAFQDVEGESPGLPFHTSVHNQTGFDELQAPEPPGPCRERDDDFARLVRREYLEVLDFRPLETFDSNCFDRGRSDETTLHVL